MISQLLGIKNINRPYLSMAKLVPAMYLASKEKTVIIYLFSGIIYRQIHLHGNFSHRRWRCGVQSKQCASTNKNITNLLDRPSADILPVTIFPGPRHPF